jgi:hypothetical protein
VIELIEYRLEPRLDFREVDDPAGVIVDGAVDVDFNSEAMPMNSSALVTIRQIRQSVSRLELKSLEYPHISGLRGFHQARHGRLIIGRSLVGVVMDDLPRAVAFLQNVRAVDRQKSLSGGEIQARFVDADGVGDIAEHGDAQVVDGADAVRTIGMPAVEGEDRGDLVLGGSDLVPAPRPMAERMNGRHVLVVMPRLTHRLGAFAEEQIVESPVELKRRRSHFVLWCHVR